MKKITLLIGTLFLVAACTVTNEQLNSDMNAMSGEMSSLHSTITDLQDRVDELTVKNEMMNAETAKSRQIAVELETEIAYLNNEVALFKKGGTVLRTTTIKPVVTPVTPAIPVGVTPVLLTPVTVTPENAKQPAKIVVIEDSAAMKSSSYDHAFDLYRNGKHEESITEFSKFLTKYPNDDYSDNAQYWIGENYYSMKQFSKAVEAFQLVLSKYPKEGKVPDAMLKIGYSYDNIGQRTKAKESLNNLVKQYPQSSASGLARQTLARW